MSALSEILPVLERVAVAVYGAGQVALALYVVHRLPMLRRPAPRTPPPEPWWDTTSPPRVLVQVPVRDEPEVVRRAVAAAAALDWPRDRLEIQLLDDSSESTTWLGAEAVAAARASGVDAIQVRRANPAGFKAGALADGLRRSEAEFVALFDADFVPPVDFIRRLLPHFAARDVGMVQARWGHLNREASLLTRAQAVILDAHQLLEHAWRERAGRFFNFNGTAGIWRRACIEGAGGWQHDTLTEDLDLSYRAQLAGWRFAFEPDVVVPAELPATMDALRTQQRRWARGALQTARKLLPAIARSPLPARVKLEAFLHLTENVNYPLLLLLALGMAPLVVRAADGPRSIVLALGLGAAGILPVVAFLFEGARRAGARGGRAWLDVAAALVLCGGLSWHLTRAVGDGLLGPTGEFVRTPKTGARGRARPLHVARPRPGSGGGVELALAGAFFALGSAAALHGHAGAVPFLASLATGLAWVGAGVRAPGIAACWGSRER